MKNFEEKRKYPRVDAKIKVAFRTGEELVEEYTRNISQGGIFLKTDRLLDPNAVLEIDMQLPGEKDEIKVVGKVRRLMVVSDPDHEGEHLYGVGIEFIDPDEEFKNRIKKLVDAELKKKEKQ